MNAEVTIESPCCHAPSTTMNYVNTKHRSDARRCVRCKRVFYVIDPLDADEFEMPTVAAAVPL